MLQNDDDYDLFQERASILEFEALLTRKEAEEIADFETNNDLFKI